MEMSSTGTMTNVITTPDFSMSVEADLGMVAVHGTVYNWNTKSLRDMQEAFDHVVHLCEEEGYRCIHTLTPSKGFPELFGFEEQEFTCSHEGISYTHYIYYI